MPSQTKPNLKLVASADSEKLPTTLEEVFRTYSSYVATIGIRILGRKDEVDDLVQDVFLEAHKGLHSLENPLAIKGWLATVTVRTARKRFRTRRLKSFFGMDQVEDYSTVAGTDASPETRALLAKVYRVLDQMPADQRLAWSLRYLQGEHLEKVAELCGCSLATAKRRIASVKVEMEGVFGDE